MTRQGFSLVELILAIGILMLVAVTASVINSRWYLQNNIETAGKMISSSVQKAQAYAMSKKNNLSWGVCLTGQTIRMFGGSCASPTIKDDYLLPVSVGVSGLSTVNFSNFRGEPDGPLNIVITDGVVSKTIIINGGGGISVN